MRNECWESLKRKKAQKLQNLLSRENTLEHRGKLKVNFGRVAATFNSRNGPRSKGDEICWNFCVQMKKITAFRDMIGPWVNLLFILLRRRRLKS